jgi:hypothetical protein
MRISFGLSKDWKKAAGFFQALEEIALSFSKAWKSLER